MSEPSRFFSAYFKDESIPHFLRECPWFAENKDCLLSVLDSRLGPIRETSTPPEWSIVHGPFLVVEGRRLLENLDIFSGFDEVYFFKSDSWRSVDPSLWTDHWTSEHCHLNRQLPPLLESILERSGAAAYLSDGDGLNLITSHPQEFQRAKSLLDRSGSS